MLRIVFAYLLLLAPAAQLLADAHHPEPLSNFPKAVVEITTPDARVHRFDAWVADTPEHREQGLMFVKDMPADAGMLFIFDQSARVSFWMENTLIPLDMLFIRADGRVDSIAENAKPLSRDLIPARSEVLTVLELNGGTARKLGIRAGAIMTRPTFKSGPAK